ncbi:MAG: phosphate acyltransferase [Comamonadaceae bacterium]|nr:phosphate acyltransferase [Comamonadaceae bacterium]
MVYAEGEDERVLRAVQVVVDEGLARPILIGRPAVIDARIEQLRPAPAGRARTSTSSTPSTTRATATTGRRYHQLTERKGVTAQCAKIEMRRRTTLIGAMLMHKGEADGMLCGTFGTLRDCTCSYVDQVIGLRAGRRARYAAMNVADAARAHGVHLSTPTSTPTRPPSSSPRSRVLAAEEMRRFGIAPKVALLSHSNFGTSDAPSARRRCARALALICASARPTSRSTARCTATPRSTRRSARELCPTRTLQGRGQPAGHARRSTRPTSPTTCSRPRPATASPIGPILLGAAKPVHILTPSATVRRIVNMTALTVVEAAAGQRK